jgi:hypothetical protein
MDKAIAHIVGATPVHSLPLGLAPGRSRTNLVNAAHVSFVSCLLFESLGISLKVREPAATVSAAIVHFKGSLPALQADWKTPRLGLIQACMAT